MSDNEGSDQVTREAQHSPQNNPGQESDPVAAAGETTSQRQSPTVVGIGASAGGLIALQKFFDAMRQDTGMAFVVVTHMDPERESLLPELLQTHTAMPVRQVQDMTGIEPNHVYVVPPNRRIVVTDTHLDLEKFEEPRGHRLPIDHFFRSLASAHSNAVAIILSGGGTDGAVGVKAIKEYGGLLLVQHPEEAEYDSMPRAAINTGLADVVLPVAELAEKLIMYRHNGVHLPQNPDLLTAVEMEAIYRILAEVQARTGHDFSQYKLSTILRRIQRRMQLYGYTTLSAYIEVLRQSNEEALALFNDLLIGVTSFFRDKEAWQALEQILPRLFEGKRQDDTVRAWAIGCATGEEAYTVAILLLEYVSTLDAFSPGRPKIQVFASDLDDGALTKAREGIYPEAIEADVSLERLERFFIKEGHYYRVRPELRDVVLFSNHSVLRDPPFSRLDLISCRNLLIYLQRDLQHSVFQIFHYALNPERYLFLGSSETAEMVHELFRTMDKTNRIYQARPWQDEYLEVPRLPLMLSRMTGYKNVRPSLGKGRLPGREVAPAANTYHLDLLEEIGPPSILVNEAHHDVHLSDTAGRYLVHPGGTPTSDLLKLVRSELQPELRTALFQAFEQNKSTISQPVYVQFNGTPHRVIMAVRPHLSDAPAKQEINARGERLALVFFLEDETPPSSIVELAAFDSSKSSPDSAQHEVQVGQLEKEIQRLHERLQTTSEEYESSNEELKAANEELQSINEEYRSTTEELETSKEELQSVNEELQTVNSELKTKLEEISRAHSDIENLMAATEIATLFLDRDLRIQRYTPSTTSLFNIMAGDRGRPISHLTHELRYDTLADDARRVLRNLIPIEREVQDLEGRRLLVRLRPYRTIDDRIDGVVITFVDVTTIWETERTLERTRERYRLMVEETAEYAMFTMDKNGRIDTWNQGAQRIFGYSKSEVLGQSGAIVFTSEDQASGALEAELEQARMHQVANDERWYQRQDGSHFWGTGAVTALWEDGEPHGYAKVMRDNTARKKAEDALQESETRYRTLAEELEERVRQRTLQVRRLASELIGSEQMVRHRIAQTLHDDLQQVLYAAKLQIVSLSEQTEQNAELEELSAVISESLRITRELTLELSPPLLPGEGLQQALEWLTGHMKEVYDLDVKITAVGQPDTSTEEQHILLYQIVRELLFNVVKHAVVKEAQIMLQEDETGINITVSDGGKGFDVKVIEGKKDGGFGLQSVRERLDLFGGKATITSEPGQGTQVHILMPSNQRDDNGRSHE